MRILYLDLDTLRADHLGCYGYHRNTAPNIDRLAAEGVRFTNAYTSDAPCLPSRTALMTGRFGIHTGVVGHGGTAADLRLQGPDRGFQARLLWQTLPGVLRQAGLHTVTISPFAERHTTWSFYAGFSEVHNTGRSGAESAEEISPVALRWIENHAREDNWFLHVNFWDAHTPYRAPEAFGNPFENDPLPPWPTAEDLAAHREMAGPHGARELNMYDNATDPRYPRQPGELKDMADLRRLCDGYDTGIRYADEHVGRLLEALERQGVLDDVAIIVSADHGENMGELGIYAEHATADHPTCRVPLVIRWPGGPRGLVHHDLHYQLDLAPTLAELLGREAAPDWDGQSFASAVLGHAPAGRESLVLSQCAHVCQRSVRFDEWLYVRTYHDGYHLFPAEMLFNLGDDPHETRNLAPDRPDLCREAVYRLNQWHDDMMASMPYDVDPLWTVIKEGGPFHARGHLRRYAERLQATGRGGAVEELRRRHPREFQE